MMILMNKIIKQKRFVKGSTYLQAWIKSKANKDGIGDYVKKNNGFFCS